MLDGNPENQRKADKKRKRQHEKRLQVQQEAKPLNSAADRLQKLRIVSLVCLTHSNDSTGDLIRLKSDKISVFGPEKDTSGAKQQLLIIHGAVLGAEAERRLIAEIFFFKVWPIMEPRHL